LHYTEKLILVTAHTSGANKRVIYLPNMREHSISESTRQ